MCFACPAELAKRLVGQLEVDGDLSLDLDWFAIQKIRLVLPLLDCIGRSFSQLLLSAQDLDLGDVAFPGDRGHQLNLTLNPHAYGA